MKNLWILEISILSRRKPICIFIADEGISLLLCKWEKIEWKQSGRLKESRKIKCSYIPALLRRSLVSWLCSAKNMLNNVSRACVFMPLSVWLILHRHKILSIVGWRCENHVRGERSSRWFSDFIAMRYTTCAASFMTVAESGFKREIN